MLELFSYFILFDYGIIAAAVILLVARYVDPSTAYPSSSDEVLPYPISPNQSWRNIAGVCDPSGLVFGLMPHPEANHSTWLGATWTRENIEHGEGEGMKIFHNAVNHVKANFNSFE